MLSPVEVVPMRVTDAVGVYGEMVAERFLAAQGLRILDRRWRCPIGEIDLVAADSGCLVVCEVKTRRSLRTGDPVEAVTPAKLRRLRRLAGAWLAACEQSWSDVRIDVVGVLVPPAGAPQVEHLIGVG